MTVRDALLRQFDLESRFTRTALARVPMEKADWKPHERSMTLGWLATFLALMWSWGNHVIERDELVAGAAAGPKPDLPNTTADLLALFDKMTAAFRAALAGTTDEALERPWTLRMTDRPPMTAPRWLMLQTFVFNHAVHHRGQLTVYLRLIGVSVPAIYNDSADERGGILTDGG